MGRKIIVIRHGETQGNHEGRFQLEEIALSERGNEQAKLLANRIKNEYGSRVKKIVASDLKRTRETAMHIFEALYDVEGLVFETHPILQERNFGDLRGRLYSEVLAKINLLEPDYRPSNGESVNDFNKRIEKTYDYIKFQANRHLAPDSDDVIVVVTHGLVKTHLARNHFDHGDQEFPPKNSKNFMFHNTSITVVELDEKDEKAKVKLINCIQHLPLELRVDEKAENKKFRPKKDSTENQDTAEYVKARSKL